METMTETEFLNRYSPDICPYHLGRLDEALFEKGFRLDELCQEEWLCVREPTKPLFARAVALRALVFQFCYSAIGETMFDGEKCPMCKCVEAHQNKTLQEWPDNFTGSAVFIAELHHENQSGTMFAMLKPISVAISKHHIEIV